MRIQPTDLRSLIDAAGAEEAQRREREPRLSTPRIQKIGERHYIEARSITEGVMLTAAPVMVELLLLSAAVLAKEPGSDAFKLSAEITRLLRQINPE